jgi:hypothetical protein
LQFFCTFLCLFPFQFVFFILHAQNNPEATGNPVPASGAGKLVAAGNDQFVLHDHVGNLAARIPDPNRAFATYKFASSVKVTKVVIVQHGNGIDEIELFSGTTSCGKSQGKAPNGQVTGPGVGLQEHVAYDYTGFSSTCPPNTGKTVPIMPPSF